MKILSFNPGHDGTFAYIEDGKLITSVEAEKDSHYRHSPLTIPDFLGILGDLKETPDILCRGGWWLGDNNSTEKNMISGYYGINNSSIITKKQNLLGKEINYFSSSHERSHILCAFGMSNLPKGTPCYALLWEGVIGAFYKIDSKLNINKISDVMPEPGHRYALLYGIGDPTFDKKTAEFSRFSDAGKLMALASFSKRTKATDEEEKLISFLMQDCTHLKPKECETYRNFRHYNVGLDDTEFRNFAGIFSDRIFDRFYNYAKLNLDKNLPLLIIGGCGLNCDWNTKWREVNYFSDVFVPPVANDSGSAIGTAIDAQFYFTGNPKIEWDVYSGRYFNFDTAIDKNLYDEYIANHDFIAELLANDLILGWINEKYEIGPRALGNRSIIAAPFQERTRIRLNEIKQREQFRPIAPVCLDEDANVWFNCKYPSPYMLYTQKVLTDTLPAITHINKTARIQTVTSESNNNLYNLLVSFKKLTGYGVLCNTSLNFNGKGFINNISDLSAYTIKHKLDGFVVNGKCYLLKSSKYYKNLNL